MHIGSTKVWGLSGFRVRRMGLVGWLRIVCSRLLMIQKWGYWWRRWWSWLVSLQYGWWVKTLVVWLQGLRGHRWLLLRWLLLLLLLFLRSSRNTDKQTDRPDRTARSLSLL